MVKSLAAVMPPIAAATGKIQVLSAQKTMIQTTHPDMVPVVADRMLFSSVVFSDMK
jgi:hypothetical protein